ncbi:MAG: hypothetical protein PHN82_07990 [bacterium]|nr:hypothetical protein [bacterium]
MRPGEPGTGSPEAPEGAGGKTEKAAMQIAATHAGRRRGWLFIYILYTTFRHRAQAAGLKQKWTTDHNYSKKLKVESSK